MKFIAKTPFIDDMGTVPDFKVSDKPLETKEEELLWHINSMRLHDGLNKLKQLPVGVVFTPITDKVVCPSCGRYKSPSEFGYKFTDDGKKTEKLCYDCCGHEDIAYMVDNGVWSGYYEKGKLVNFPSTVSFPVFDIRKSKNNFGADRVDFRFNGPDGYIWCGYQVGNSSTLARCKKTKKKWAYSKTGTLVKDRVERYSRNMGKWYFVNAWRIVDNDGEDMIQPWQNTKGEAKKLAEKLNIKILE